MAGLIAYGAYVPFWRVARSDIGDFLGTRAGRGHRAVAAFDEDTTTMAVEAARLAVRTTETPVAGPLFFATSDPAYGAKTNAHAIHAALDLDATAAAFDLAGGVRSGVGATLAAERLGGIAVIADRMSAPAGSADEAQNGDAAAALIFGDEPHLARLVGVGNLTREYLERWRAPGETWVRSADQRFIEHVQGKLIDQSVAEALKDADITSAEVDHVVVAAPTSRSRRVVARAFGRSADELVADIADEVGYSGVAHWGVLLASALDRAGADEHVAVVIVGEGISTLVFHTTRALPTYREDRAANGVPALADQLRNTGQLSYSQFLTWSGTLVRDQPPRATPQTFSPVAAERNVRWKYGLVKSADGNRGGPNRVGLGGRTGTAPELRLADEYATIHDVTVDHAAGSPAGPALIAVVEFADGTRLSVELADIDGADGVRVGDRVDMTFRRLHTTDGVHDYFWKARLAPATWRS